MDTACSIAYDCNLLVLGVELGIPIGRVAEMAFELVQSRIIRKPPRVEDADCGDGKVKVLIRRFASRSVLDGQFPLRSFGIPDGAKYFGVEFDVLVDIVLSAKALPVVSNLGSLGELFGPLGLWRECGLVDVCWDVASYAGICSITVNISRLVGYAMIYICSLTMFLPGAS